MAKLVERKNGFMTRNEIILGEDFIIGRFDPEKGPVDIDLSDYEGAEFISRQHARIFLNECDNKDKNDTPLEKCWFIEDLESRNGTFLRRGKTVFRLEPDKPVMLQNEDIINLAGKIEFVFFTDDTNG